MRVFAYCIMFVISYSAYAQLSFNPNIQDGQSSYTIGNGRTQYHKPSYKREGDRVYEVRDGRTQYHRQIYKIEGNTVYEEKDGRTQYHRPSYRIE